MKNAIEIADLLEGSATGFVVLDAAMRYRYVNPAAERIAGRCRDEMIGREPAEVFPEARGTEALKLLQRTFDNRERLDTETYFDPWARWFRTRMEPLADGGLMIQFDDVTESRQALDDMRETDRRKDEFLATLAHELRNPLAPIRNALQLLLSGKASDHHQLHSMMDRQVHHLTRLVDDLLEVSRIRRGKVQLRREHFDIRDALESAVESVEPDLQHRSQELAVVQPSQPLYIYGDPVRLTQVVTNLLSNASKYTADGGSIRLTAQLSSGSIVIEVEDNGIGIPAGTLEQVFEPFLQGKALAARNTVGLGLGLTVVQDLVEQHDGRVEVHSPGAEQGTRFTVTLPASQATPAKRCRPNPIQSQARLSPLTVLVVDDNRDAADSLALLLRANGCAPITCYDGQSAYQAALEEQPNVLVLDIGLPDMSGYEVARRVRQIDDSYCPAIIALTGWGQDEDRAESAASGIDHHLVKPADWEALQKILEKHRD